MKCDIIVISWNYPELIRACVEHILENTRYPYRLIVIDNASESETINYLKSLKNNKSAEIELILNKENLGWVRAVNQGIKISDAPYVCICNNDILPGVGWLTELVKFAETHHNVGLVNPLCSGHIDKDLTVNEYAKLIASSNQGKYMEMNQCQGFCMLVKREVVDKIGFLDERFNTVGFDDTDYSRRAHIAGYKCVSLYSSYVYHKEHASFGRMGYRKKIQAILEKKYYEKWPRHKRVLMSFSIFEDTSDEKIVNFLNSALFLAREWCWVNLLVFGDKNTRKRVDEIKERINFSLHQNIKFNDLNSKIKVLEIAIRILERTFGTKKRKRYDIVIYGERKLAPLLNILCSLHGALNFLMDFGHFPKEELNSITGRLMDAPFQDMKCDIILPVCDQYKVTKECIESIVKNTDTPYRLIIINNGKNPRMKKLLNDLEKHKDVETTIVHNNHNIGWVKALNRGLELSMAPYICFQNDDTIVTRGWLRKMINTLRLEDDFGMINPTWEGRPSSISIDRYNSILEKREEKPFVETDWCRGFSVVIKKKVIEKIGRVDEIFGLAYFDDVDYSVRAIEAGFICLRALDTYVYHKRNVTFSEVLKGKRWNELHERNKLIYYKKWGRPLKIVMVLNKEACRDKFTLSKIKRTAFYLARKQHHIDVWSPYRLADELKHTNIKLKVHPGYILQLLVFFDLYMNKKKRKEKRYDAIFNFNHIKDEDFDKSIAEAVDKAKEKTKELINV